MSGEEKATNSKNLQPVSNLLCVAKVLYDQRFCEVVQENTLLRLQLFWKDHHLGKLKEAMSVANDTYTKCKCLACAVSGRMYEGEEGTETSHCTFKPWFETQLNSLGMTVQWTSRMNENDTHMCLGCSGRSVWDDDCHFCHFSSRDDWFCFTYGSKVWNAKSANDKELLKLESLFQILYHDPEEENDSS